MRRSCVLIIGLLLLGFASSALAEVKLPAVVGSNMVLQRGEKVPVWGWCEPGTKVHVVFDKKAVKTVADEKGRWQVTLGPLAVGEPRTMVIETGRGDRVQLDNVLVGEVWLCSGQSNMEMTMQQTPGSETAIAQATHPKLRLFQVKNETATEPREHGSGRWVECDPKQAANFSAVGYYFGRKLLDELDVPVGLIEADWGATPIETWTPLEALEAQEVAKPLLASWEASIEKNAKLAQHRDRPANLYNAMIHPLVPYGLRGVIWYQGESNRARAVQYQTLFSAMIGAWRRAWSKPDMPFGFVQLAPFHYTRKDAKQLDVEVQKLPELWHAQLSTLKSVPSTGMAVTIDVTTLQNIHPPKKEPVGDRLALWALATVYGKDLVYSGPIYKEMKVEGDTIRLTFDHAGVGLKSSDGKPLTDFTIAGPDEKFYPATATIDGQTIVVNSPQVKTPVAVRLGWTETSMPNLVNQEGLPASPFKTDTFKLVTEGQLTP